MNHSTRRLSYSLLVAVMAVVLGAPHRLSALELNRYFSNDMVLQRDKPVKVWGTGEKGESVTVTFAGQTKSAKANGVGRWIVTLDPMQASREGRKMVVSSSIGNQKAALGNVLVGDVFLFARQSSIDVSLGTTEEGREAAADLATDKTYRFVQIKASPSREPLDNLKKDATSGWQTVDNKSALTMSAAAFYLGRDLAKGVDVPIGIVDLDMGYHFASAWMSEEGLEKVADLEMMGASDVAWQMADRAQKIKDWEKRLEGYIPDKNGKRDKRGLYKKTDQPIRGFSPFEMPFYPSACYNTVIHPLRGLTVKGLLLQLGNDYPFVAFTRLRNMGKSTDMARLHKANGDSYTINKQGNRMTPCVLPAAVDDLRRSLGEASLRMGWIMPPGSDVYQYGTHNREVREVQRRAQAGSKGVDLILPGAEHVRMSGQPADEALLAERCKQWVMGTFYGAKGPVTGPLFDRAEYGNDTATIFFKSGTAAGLTAEGDALEHFEVAGGDRQFVPCKAEIDGSTIKLTSDTGDRLMYVRFGWSRKPVQGLVNSAGLPALPFNTNSEWEYDWWPEPADINLPEEYYTPANKWPDRNYAIINYATEGKDTHLGPTGIWGTPSGPNLCVGKITTDSPADGKVIVDDLIYGVNGTEFGSGPDDKYHQLTDGIAKAEAEKGGGTVVLNIRREDKLIEVPIKLEHMGSYSDTSPWKCEKSKLIVKKAEEWMRNGLRPESGVPNEGNYAYEPWNANILFLLASGNPELQGLVRRYVRQKMDGFAGNKGWSACYMALLFGEYYHRTGDPTVLPHIEELVQGFEANTPRDWPPTTPSRYGLHPAAQMPSAMGMLLAKEAGIKVDPESLYYALRHLHDGRAENGFILYNGYSAFLPSQKAIDEPQPIDPLRREAGMLSSMNGKLGTGAALFSMLDGYDKAVSNCAEQCVYAFNRTRTGHGGAWFNNYWTPVGAHHAGKEKFQHFMKGQQWWRELYRDHTGAVWQEHNAKGKASVLGVGFVVHRVAHHKRLRMFGAPRSAFGPNPPAYLKEALAAHRKRDYALAEKLSLDVLAKGNVPAEERAMVEHFLDTAQMLRESVEFDLAYTENCIERGEYYLANLELPQLKMVVPPESERLKAIASALESKEAKSQMVDAAKRAQQQQQSAREAGGEAKTDKRGNWEQELASIVTLVKDRYDYPGPIKNGKRLPVYPKEEWNHWRLTALETPSHTPKGWEKPGFDDSHWDEVPLPIVWPMAHTALLRTTFEVKDVSAYNALHVRANAYKQRSLEIYLNGELVAKVNNIPRQGVVDFPLTPYAMTLLKNGENHLAVSAQHGKRMVNFAFRLEGRLKE